MMYTRFTTFENEIIDEIVKIDKENDINNIIKSKKNKIITIEYIQSKIEYYYSLVKNIITNKIELQIYENEFMKMSSNAKLYITEYAESNYDKLIYYYNFIYKTCIALINISYKKY